MIEPDDEGGLFHFAYQLCRALGAEGHPTHLITASTPELTELGDNFQILPVMRLWSRREVMSAEQQSSQFFRFLFAVRRVHRGLKLTKEWIRVLRLARSLKPDVIVVSMILHPHIRSILERLVPRDVVLAQICHEFVDREQAGRKRPPGSTTTSLDRFDRVFLLSEATRGEFLAATGFDPLKATRIPHGEQGALILGGATQANIRRDLGLGPATPVLLFFGVLRRSKGLTDLVEAFAMSKARYTSQLVIAGRATKYIRIGDLEDRIRQLGVGDRIVLHNAYIDNSKVAGFFDMAQAVVLPYRSASASGVLHLAYTCGRPVIATSIGGLAEDVIDGETGLLVPPCNPAELAKAIDTLMSDPDLAHRIGVRGKQLSEETYSWTNVARIVSETLAGDVEARSLNAS